MAVFLVILYFAGIACLYNNGIDSLDNGFKRLDSQEEKFTPWQRLLAKILLLVFFIFILVLWPLLIVPVAIIKKKRR